METLLLRVMSKSLKFDLKKNSQPTKNTFFISLILLTLNENSH